MNSSQADRTELVSRSSGIAVLLLAAALITGCDNSSSTPDPSATTMPTTQTASDTPPLDPTVVSLDDHHRVGSMYWADGDTPDGGQGSPMGTLECVYPSPIDYHVHAHLSIFFNGEQLSVPASIGIVELSPSTECHYPVHTHDATGIIHLHATAPTDFTLGQLFAIWGQPLERDDVAGFVGLPAVVYVTDDGVVSEYTGDLHDLQFLSHREITIQIGTPITTIPQYTWTAE